MKNTFLTRLIYMGGFALVFFITAPEIFPQCSTPAFEDFQVVVLENDQAILTEPVHLAVVQDISDGRVFMVNMTGEVLVHKPGGETVQIAKMETGFDNADGLMGVAVHPDFKNKPWIYLYYSKNLTLSRKLVLERYDVVGDTIDHDSKKTVLEIPRHMVDNNNSGGGLAWDNRGNLLIGVGDNSDAGDSINAGFAPLYWKDDGLDAQKSASNTNDLRGKILRIHMEDDGTYSIPPGNFWEHYAAEFEKEGDPDRAAQYRDSNLVTREFYVMGCRNPYRFGVNKITGWLAWGDLGPEAGIASPSRGPLGYDELNLAATPGFYGYPYLIGDNFPYWYMDYDNLSGLGNITYPYQADSLVNNSPNNTGIKDFPLPAARPPVIWYSDSDNNEGLFNMGTGGGEAAMSGPWFHWNPDVSSNSQFPPFFNGKVVFWDWERSGQTKILTFDEEGRLAGSMPWNLSTDGTPTGPAHFWGSPISMEFGPEGALYVLKYSNSGYQSTTGSNARMLYRIEYTGPQYDPALCGVVSGCTNPEFAEYNPAANAHSQSACHTPVSTRQANQGRASKTRLMTSLHLSNRVEIPRGANGFNVYDLKGRKIWEYHGEGNAPSGWIEIPPQISEIGVLYLEFSGGAEL